MVTKAPYRIYVVEDSAIMLRLILDLLAGIPGALIVGHADRADVAVVEIADSVPDAIIIDLMLQSGTGYDVLKAARHSTNAPVVIVLTNLTMPPHRDQAMGLGADHFFDKSTEVSQMLRLVNKLAQQHQLGDNHG